MGISPTPSDQHRQEKRIMNEGVKISRFGIFPKVSVPCFCHLSLIGGAIHALWRLVQ